MSDSIPNDVLAIAQSASKAFSTERADQGYGSRGVWPNEGHSQENDAELIAINITPSEFSYGQGDNRQTRRAFDVQFMYRSMNAEGDGLFPWSGVAMNIVSDPDTLPNTKGQGFGDQRARASIDRRRLKGSLAALLGYEPNDIGAGLTEALQLLSSATANGGVLNVVVFCEFRSETYTPRQGPHAGEQVTQVRARDFIRRTR